MDRTGRIVGIETSSRAGVLQPSTATDPRRVRHYFTVDVEEYFQVSAFEPYIPRSQWESMESRVEQGVDRLLEVLDRFETRATFFVLGWIVDRNPELVRRIHRAGHEIGSHGWNHRRVLGQTPDEFRDSVRRTKDALEGVTGDPVLGYRAPSFSITPGMEWTLDVLLEEGYRYDSSLFPIRRSGYGYPCGGRDVHWLDRAGGRLLEAPPATIRRFGRNYPAGGGAYFRLLPYQVISSAVRDFERRGVPATFYIHPWEVDPHQPRIPFLSLGTRIRHYGGIGRTMSRLERLLSDFRFGRVKDGIPTVHAL
jgi:polysaccharide deacetylase family protein (PEP-CTERM system associated)